MMSARKRKPKNWKKDDPIGWPFSTLIRLEGEIVLALIAKQNATEGESSLLPSQAEQNLMLAEMQLTLFENYLESLGQCLFTRAANGNSMLFDDMLQASSAMSDQREKLERQDSLINELTRRVQILEGKVKL